MEPKFQTSFIPKKSLSSAGTIKRAAKRVDILFLVSMIAFLAAIALSGGVFIYGKFVDSNITKKTALLEEAKASFNPELISELSRLSRKMTAAEELLANHVSAASIFRAVSETTLKSIQFEDFTYEYEADKVTVSMRGKANGFGSIALQSDLFGKNKIIRKPVFSNLNLDNAGKVNFLFTAEIDPASILYKNTLTTTN